VTTFPEIPFPLTGDRVRIEAADGDGGYAIVRLADDVAVGQLRLEVEADQLTVCSLCIEVAYRGYGCGSEAGWLLVQASESRGRLRAWAPPDRGLAVYYWIRMGLRPLPGKGPGGGIWFERRR